ncbi:MAG: methylated-DNA--[protein]-cysteine S-methyltransferase [Planctomycetes bacterium]|nr:methylated-DNA--[protein]-cysteine S-methyltransferase [Planctomycetota bacterium]
MTRDIMRGPMASRYERMCGGVLQVDARSGALRTRWRAEAPRRRALARDINDARLLRDGLRMLRAWRRTGEVDVRLLAPLLPAASAFTSACWLAAAQIPRGQTCTYAELAARAGRRGAARAAASAMARNPLPPLVPCHRVVSRGGIGGFCGVAQRQQHHWAIRLKHALLRRERAIGPYTSTPAPRAIGRAQQRRSHS